MDNGSYTSCAGVKVTGEQADEARMNTMVMDWNRRHEYQLLIHLLWVQAVTHRNIHRCVYIHGLVEYICFLTLSADRARKQGPTSSKKQN